MAKNVDKQNFANYLAEAKTWETSRVRTLEKSAKTAWLVAIAAGVLALISVVTVAVLGPQKTAVPYVIRVNNTTGAIDVISALKDGKTNYDEALNKYHLQWYVRWREGYSKNLINEYYTNVGIMSAPPEQANYGALMSKNNPQSPLKIYAESVVTIKIKSTSFIKENVALVRYTKEIVGGQSAGLTHWAATITFQYVGTPMSEENRAINPLGFQVIEYRNDPDQEITENSLPSNNIKQSLAAPTVAPASQASQPAVPSLQ